MRISLGELVIGGLGRKGGVKVASMAGSVSMVKEKK